MQQSITLKQDWIQRIQEVIAHNIPFQYQTITGNKLFVLFAADTFRRSGHEVCIDIVPTESRISCLIITIFPKKTSIEFTLRRHDEPHAIIQQIINSNCTKVSLRGCGTVVYSVFQIMDWALHSGWYVDNTMMSTLTQQKTMTKQRNTTLHIVIRKG
tara:strand:+ start:3436 stop:3906 length:471 start_codon:yes stop_codon:yes gene_type:complete